MIYLFKPPESDIDKVGRQYFSSWDQVENEFVDLASWESLNYIGRAADYGHEPNGFYIP